METQKTLSLSLCMVLGKKQRFYSWVGNFPWQKEWLPTPLLGVGFLVTPLVNNLPAMQETWL